MKRKILERVQIDSVKIWLPVILVIATALLIFANHCDLGFTYDSYLYIEIADQISKQGLLSAEGYHTKPPLYPLLIYWFGEESIFVINLVCFLITICILYFFGLEVKTKMLRLFFWSILLFSTPLYLVHSFAWTEPPFICILLLAFFSLHIYQKHGKLRFLYLSLILLLLLPFIRFAGIFILIPTLLVLLLNLPTKLKWVLIGIIGFGIFICSIWVWKFEAGFLQRWHTFISPFSTNSYSRYTHNIDSYLEAFSIWILPLPVYKPIRLFFAVIALVTIGVSSINCLWKRGHMIKSGLPLIFLIYYLSLHFVFIVEYYAAERYMTPLYNLLILALFMQLDQKLAIIGNNIKTVTLALLFAFLMYGVVRTTKNVVFWNQVRCVENY